MATGGVTQIDTTYLNGLKGQLQTALTDVQTQLKGIGSSPAGWVNPIDQNFSVLPGPTSFNAGAALNTALKTMGGSIHDQLTWLQKVLTDMINEITTTVNSFSNSESLNTESVNQLITDFQGAINDMNSPPSGNGTPAPSNTPPPNGSGK
jgi:hypothetical protein